MSYCVYKHTSPNGKVYIGITSQIAERRWRADGSGYRQNERFYNAIKKYGWENFTHEVLFDELTESEACKKEKELIKYYRSYEFKYGYNQTLGGDHGVLTTASREKISGSVSVLWSDPEYRQHMSDAHKGKATTKGLKKSPEERQRMREIALKRFEDPIYREKMVSIFRAHAMTLTKEQMSERSKKMWSDPELRKRLTEKHIGNHYRAKRVLCVETGVIYESTLAASKAMGCARETIGQVCRGEREMTHGYHWRFADEQRNT